MHYFEQLASSNIKGNVSTLGVEPTLSNVSLKKITLALRYHDRLLNLSVIRKNSSLTMRDLDEIRSVRENILDKLSGLNYFFTRIVVKKDDLQLQGQFAATRVT